VDLPTYVLWDPADFGGGAAYGGTVTWGSRWARFDAPTEGPQLLVNGELSSTDGMTVVGWRMTAPAAARTGTEDGRPALALVSARVSDSVNAIQELPLSPGRYLVRFETRALVTAGEPRLYLQLLDASGAVIETAPTGAGYAAGTSGSWTVGSFLADAPVGTVSGRLWLRNRGAGATWFRSVEIRPVLPPLTP
jgi:hypothetical protein